MRYDHTFERDMKAEVKRQTKAKEKYAKSMSVADEVKAIAIRGMYVRIDDENWGMITECDDNLAEVWFKNENSDCTDDISYADFLNGYKSGKIKVFEY